MGVYKYDAINDELIPIAGVPSVPGIEDKVSTYTADATYWDTSPTAASIKPVTSGGIKTEIDKKLSTYAVDSTAWDAAPTTASTKPVISDGIKTQFDLVHNELSDVNNILGSKNILPNSATTQVINGITYTVAADGSINVNGTASADSILHIVPGTTGKLSNIFSKGGNYIISVGTTGTGVNVFFGIEYTGSTWDIAEWLTYSTRLSKEIYIDGTQLNNSSSYIESYIKVNSGTTVSNIKVYPMLRPSSVRDDTYVPYSKTNYELTTEISNLAKQLDDITVYKTDAYSGTTSSSSAVVGTVTNLPKGRYLVIPSGYSNYGGYMNSPVAGYVSNLGVIENPTKATYYVYSPTSSAATWTNYQVNFIKIG